MAHNKRRYGLLISLVFTIGLVSIALWQRQFIYDQVKLYGYEPSAAVRQIATDTAMTDGARRVFYVNHPEIIDRQRFSNFCSIKSEQAAVLGCYKGPQQGIYLLNVSNVELNGIEEVTAAHEMLHAEYDRMGPDEQDRINKLLQNFYDTKLNNEETKKTIDSYRKSAPDDLVNEMHSIIGTQVDRLTPELEEHYAQYFTDRTKVVLLYKKYEQAFTSRQNQIESFDSQLEDLKQTLDDLETSVTRQADGLRSRQAQLSRSANNTDNATYNAQVDTYNSAVSSYNTDVRRLRSLIDQYNELVEKRNEISFEEQQLVEAISTPNVEQQ